VRPDRAKIFDDRSDPHQGGSYRHYDVRAVPIERDGKIVEWVGASSDVTSQRRPRMRGRLTEQLSARRCAPRAAAGHLDAGRGADGEQVVEVITEWPDRESARFTPRWRCWTARAQGGQRRPS